MQDNNKKPKRVVYDYEYDLKRQAKNRNDIKRVVYDIEKINATKNPNASAKSTNNKVRSANNIEPIVANNNINNNNQILNQTISPVIKNDQSATNVNLANNKTTTGTPNYSGNNNLTPQKSNTHQKKKYTNNTKQFKSNYVKQNRKEKVVKKSKPVDKNIMRKSKSSNKNSSGNSIVLSDAKKNRKKRKALMACILLIAVITGSLISFYVLFRIDSIEVLGESQYSHTQIINASGLKIGDNLFLFNNKDVATKMQSTLPYLQDITIARSIPGTIKINVTNAKPCYFIQNGSQSIALSEKFVVLETNFEKADSIIEIIGVSEIETPTPGSEIVLKNEQQLNALHTVLNEIEKNEFENVDFINVEDVINISFLYENRVEIIIGSYADADKKIEFAKYLLTSQDDNSIPSSEQGTLNVSTRDSQGRLEASWVAQSTM